MGKREERGWRDGGGEAGGRTKVGLKGAGGREEEGVREEGGRGCRRKYG